MLQVGGDVTTTLSDLLTHLGALTPATAERWVSAALAEAAALREYDDRLYPLTDDSGLLEAARRLHGAWQRWADEAEALLQRMGQRAERGPRVLGLDDLRFLIARSRALGKMPPDELASRHQRVQAGAAQVFTAEEVRRELGIAHRG
jgi:hypothetical protein